MEENERDAIQNWMREMMQIKMLTANSWATLAGTSPTNITRFLNSDSKFLPSARTLAKLSKIVGSSPQLLDKSTEARHTIPVMDYKGKCVNVILFDRDDVVAYKCRRYTGMGAKGVSAFASVIVEPRNSFNECNDGDTVLFNSWCYEILAAEYRAGLLYFFPRDPMSSPKEFENGKDGYTDWSACPIEVIGDDRLYGKIIHAIIDF